MARIDQCCYFIEMLQYYILSTHLYNMIILRIWVSWDLMLPQVDGSKHFGGSWCIWRTCLRGSKCPGRISG